jgi:DNA-binding winged helix-turn-helix (wHTH) protein
MGIYTAKNDNAIDRLLSEFFAAPDRHFLSKEDIRQDILWDEYARDGCIRQLIYSARKTLAKENLPWEIHTICRKGYRLVPKHMKDSNDE